MPGRAGLIALVLALLGTGSGRAASAQSSGAPPEGTAPSPAGADLQRSAAQSLLDEGNLRFKAGDFEGALVRYRRAQELYPSSAAKMEFNVAKAERARGNEPAAAVAFERFLKLAPAAGEEFRAEAAAMLRDLAAVLGTLQVEAPRSGLTVVVGGHAQGTTPIADGIPLRPGLYLVMLEEGDHVVFKADVEVRSGATVRVSMVDLTRAAPLPRPDASNELVATQSPAGTRAPGPPHRPLWKKWWFWTASAAVVAGALTAVVIMRSSSCPSGVECDSIYIPPPR